MTTPTSCDTADHQFLAQEVILDDAIPVEIGYLSTLWAPLYKSTERKFISTHS